MIILRQVLSNQRLERVQIVPLLGRDGYDLGIGQLLLQPLQVRDQLGFFVHAVGFVDCNDQRAGHVLNAFEHQLVLIGPARTVDHENHHIDVLQGRRGIAVHVAVQGLVVGLVHTGGIDVDRLHVTLGLDAEHVVAGGLRLARGDRQLLAEDVVEQGRLAHVGAADDGHVAAAGRVAISHCHSPRPGRSVQTRQRLARQYAG
ncbi:hypothetical protein D3C79_718180 [compost metagenome]